MSQEQAKSLKERIHEKVQAVKERAAKADVAAEALEVGEEEAKRLEEAATLGDVEAVEILRLYHDAKEEAGKNPLALLKFGVFKLRSEMRAGTVTFVDAVKRAVSIKALCGVALDEAKRVYKEDKVTFYDLEARHPWTFAVSMVMTETKELLRDLKEYRKAEQSMIMKALQDGEISPQVAARRGIELCVGRCWSPEEAKNRRAPHFRSGDVAYVPYPFDPENSDANRESMDFFQALEKANEAQRAQHGEGIRKFLLPAEKVKEEGSFVDLLAGAPGFAILVDVWKPSGQEVSVGVKVERKERGEELYLTQVSYRPWAETLFTRMDDNVKVTVPYRLGYSIHEEESSGQLRAYPWKDADPRLKALFMKRQASEMATGRELGNALKKELQAFRETIISLATVSPKEMMKGRQNGYAAVCHDEWKVRGKESEELHPVTHVDALVQREGETITIVKANLRAEQYLLGGLRERSFTYDALPKHIFAWIAQAQGKDIGHSEVRTSGTRTMEFVEPPEARAERKKSGKGKKSHRRHGGDK